MLYYPTAIVTEIRICGFSHLQWWDVSNVNLFHELKFICCVLVAWYVNIYATADKHFKDIMCDVGRFSFHQKSI